MSLSSGRLEAMCPEMTPQVLRVPEQVQVGGRGPRDDSPGPSGAEWRQSAGSGSREDTTGPVVLEQLQAGILRKHHRSCRSLSS